MPKRRNPFGDDSPLQFKTHVRTKELNAGIGGEHAMKSVYDKTKDLLFSGAKKNLYDSPMVMDANENHPMIPNNNNNNNIILPPGSSFVQGQGQMVMTHEGQLTMPSASGDHDEMDTHPGSSHSDTKCEKKYTWDFSKKKAQPPGQLILSPTKERCNFCEKVFLNFNTAQCCACNGKFCQLCSTTNYDESTERIFCLNCCP